MRAFKIISSLVVILLIAIAILAFIGFILFNFYRSSETTTITEPVSILLIGTDSDGTREGVPGVRADALIMATLNPENKNGNIEVNFVSIPRDTLAPISCADGVYEKVNSAFNSGYITNQSMQEGAECTVQTVSELLNVPIQYYIQISFEGLIAFVDILGGITLTASATFCEQDADGNEDAYCFVEGETYLMDGEMTLAYARHRYSDSDYYRAQRQQEVVLAIVKQFLSGGALTASEMFTFMSDYMTTNITLNEITAWSNYALTLFENVKKDLAYNSTITLQIIDSSPYSKVPMSFTKTTAIEPTDIGTVYGETAKLYNESIDVYEKVFTTQETKIAQQLPPKNYIANNYVIEFQTIVLFNQDLSTDSGYYAYPEEESLYYTSNYLRESLGLEVEEPPYDYEYIEKNY